MVTAPGRGIISQFLLRMSKYMKWLNSLWPRTPGNYFSFFAENFSVFAENFSVFAENF
jgi:hypothetical protein